MIRTYAKYLSRSLAVLMVVFLNVVAAQAQQDLFKTVVKVNNLSITQYELNQRELFLTLLRAPGDPKEEARKGLIDDRLRASATQAAGISLNNEDVLQGMEEFAARANLSGEEFVAAIGQAGVAEETFRDFVAAGLAWRQYVRGRFGPRAQVSEAEVDRALALQSSRGGARVLLAEILLPLAGPQEQRSRALIQRLSDTITTEAAFSAAARRYSAAPTRGRGGRLDWLPLGQVPPQLRAAVLTLEPGEVTDPIALGPGIGIFQLRGLEETDAEDPETLALEYATILIPGGRSEAALAQAQKYSDEYDTCDDLYTPAKDLPEDYFERVVLPAADVPGDIAVELMKLDNDEVSTALTRQNGAFLVYLQLCGRTVEIPVDEESEEAEDGEEGVEEIDLRAQTRDQLFQQRLASYADSALQELRADALIIEQ